MWWSFCWIRNPVAIPEEKKRRTWRKKRERRKSWDKEERDGGEEEEKKEDQKYVTNFDGRLLPWMQWNVSNECMKLML